MQITIITKSSVLRVEAASEQAAQAAAEAAGYEVKSTWGGREPSVRRARQERHTALRDAFTDAGGNYEPRRRQSARGRGGRR